MLRLLFLDYDLVPKIPLTKFKFLMRNSEAVPLGSASNPNTSG